MSDKPSDDDDDDVRALARTILQLVTQRDEARAERDALVTQLAHVRAVTAEVARQIECYVLADCQPEPPLFKWETMLEQLAGDAPKEQQR